MALNTKKPKDTLVDDVNVVEQVAEPTTETAVADSEGDAIAGELHEAQDHLPSSPTTNAPAVVGAGAAKGLQQFIDELKQSGFAGLKLEFGTIPLLSLDKGDFKVGEKDIGSSPFHGIAISNAPKYCYRPSGNVPQGVDEQAWDDSPQAHLSPDSEVAKAIADWKEKGWTFKQSEYQSVVMYIQSMPSAPEVEGSFVLLSVSPTSVKYYTAATLKCKSKGYQPYECLMEVGVGEKIKGDSHTWQPWSFKVLGSLKKLGIEVSFGQRDEDF